MKTKCEAFRLPYIIIVSGAPGSGKSSLAAPLAKALGVPLFSKDKIKEVLFDQLDCRKGDLADSRRIGGAAMELMWTLARQAPCAVMEANFRPYSAYEREQLKSLDAEVLEIHCECGLEEASRRFQARASEAKHHPAHLLKELSTVELSEYDRPVAFGEVVRVDTRHPVNIDELVTRLSKLLS